VHHYPCCVSHPHVGCTITLLATYLLLALACLVGPHGDHGALATFLHHTTCYLLTTSTCLSSRSSRGSRGTCYFPTSHYLLLTYYLRLLVCSVLAGITGHLLLTYYYFATSACLSARSPRGSRGICYLPTITWLLAFACLLGPHGITGHLLLLTDYHQSPWAGRKGTNVVNKWCLGLKALSAYLPLFAPFLCTLSDTFLVVWLVLCPLSVGLRRVDGAFRVTVRDLHPSPWPPTHTPLGGRFSRSPMFFIASFTTPQ